MKNKTILSSIILLSHLCTKAQTNPVEAPAVPLLYFVSDTQQPMMVEKLVLKSNHNKTATADIFTTILQERPKSLYMLGDVVGLGYANHKWKKVDVFLDSCRKQGTVVCGVLGNHEVMGRRAKGEQNFQKRFPMNVRTGYVSITDSVAVVLLNSNFNSLSEEDLAKQQAWYKSTLISLDSNEAIKAVIVACHHAPFTNSKIVGCSNKVQQYFVADYIQSKKAQLFITGHAHAFEHFKIKGKDFLVIGGGGGLHQPLETGEGNITDLAIDYKPMFHYLTVKRVATNLFITSHFLKSNFAGFENGLSFNTNFSEFNIAKLNDESQKESTN
jgi:UDP-2,3-diacylglucosamine pyrophosphatase LpxH